MVLATSYTEAILNTAFHWPALDHMVILVAKDPGEKRVTAFGPVVESCKGKWNLQWLIG